MEANQIIIIAVITSIILSIIVSFIVLTIIKHKYPAILTKKIYFKYDIKPDDLKINSIIFEDRDSYLNFLNNFIKHVNTTRRNNSKEDIVIY